MEPRLWRANRLVTLAVLQTLCGLTAGRKGPRPVAGLLFGDLPQEALRSLLAVRRSALLRLVSGARHKLQQALQALVLLEGCGAWVALALGARWQRHAAPSALQLERVRCVRHCVPYQVRETSQDLYASGMPASRSGGCIAALHDGYVGS